MNKKSFSNIINCFICFFLPNILQKIFFSNVTVVSTKIDKVMITKRMRLKKKKMKKPMS